MFKSLIIVVALGLSLVMFQNCQKAGFTGGVNAQSKGVLTPVSTENDEVEDLASGGDDNVNVNVNPTDPDAPSVPVPPTTEQPVPPPTAEIPAPRPPEEEGADDNATGNYVCILDGPGKSVKLGISSDGKLRGQNKIPQVLCMTEYACLELASRVFVVKGPELRGYCKSNGNPHVSHITNGELEVKVNALAAP